MQKDRGLSLERESKDEDNAVSKLGNFMKLYREALKSKKKYANVNNVLLQFYLLAIIQFSCKK